MTDDREPVIPERRSEIVLKERQHLSQCTINRYSYRGMYQAPLLAKCDTSVAWSVTQI